MSRHFASDGGSSFIACSRTSSANQHSVSSVPRQLITLNFNILSWFDPSRVRPNAIPAQMVRLVANSIVEDDSYCFGAVVLTSVESVFEPVKAGYQKVLTLKATGSLFGFLSRKTSVTSFVKGP